MLRWASASGVLIGALMALCGCASTGPAVREPGRLPTPTVELLTPGTGPLQVLRFTPKLGQREQMVLTLSMGVGMSMVAAPPVVERMPAVALTCEVEVVSLDGDGTFGTRLTVLAAEFVEDPTAQVDVAVELASAIEPLVGMTAVSRTTSRGVTLATEVHAPSEVDAATRQMMDSVKESLAELMQPLPVEAVGVGARWRVQSDLDVGLRVRRTTMVELVEARPASGLAGTNVTLRVNVSQTAPRQVMKLPDTAATTVVTLTSLEGRGDGELALDLGHLVPDASHVALVVKTRAQVVDPTVGEFPLSVQMETTIDVVPR